MFLGPQNNKHEQILVILYQYDQLAKSTIKELLPVALALIERFHLPEDPAASVSSLLLNYLQGGQ